MDRTHLDSVVILIYKSAILYCKLRLVIGVWILDESECKAVILVYDKFPAILDNLKKVKRVVAKYTPDRGEIVYLEAA